MRALQWVKNQGLRSGSRRTLAYVQYKKVFRPSSNIRVHALSRTPVVRHSGESRNPFSPLPFASSLGRFIPGRGGSESNTKTKGEFSEFRIPAPRDNKVVVALPGKKSKWIPAFAGMTTVVISEGGGAFSTSPIWGASPFYTSLTRGVGGGAFHAGGLFQHSRLLGRAPRNCPHLPYALKRPIRYRAREAGKRRSLIERDRSPREKEAF